MASESPPYVDKAVFPVNMGEETGFEYVFRSYHASLHYFCEQLIADSDAAEDIINQLFLNLWQKKVVFQDSEHAQAYLYRSTKNACLNSIRSKKRAIAKTDKAAQVTVETTECYLDAFIRTEVWAELYRAIESLPSQCCKVITKSYLEGMSNQEIADDLDLSIQTVKNYKLRGLGILRNKLPGHMFIILTALCFK